MLIAPGVGSIASVTMGGEEATTTTTTKKKGKVKKKSKLPVYQAQASEGKFVLASGYHLVLGGIGVNTEGLMARNLAHVLLYNGQYHYVPT